jgi:hypothetical protein
MWNFTKYFSLPFSLGLIGLFFIVMSKYVEIYTGVKSFEIAWLASFSIMLSMLSIRFFSLDMKKFEKLIIETNPFNEQTLHPQRFVNGMTFAMIIGFTATVSIHYNFILGMLVYLVMQLGLIFAFSGISVFNPKILFYNDSFKRISIFTLIFWLSIILFVYFVFVFNGTESLIVIPYVIALGTMAHYSWYGLPYSQRSGAFRFMIIIASAIFVFSDSLIGNSRYGLIKFESLYFLIDMTYVLNIFLMSQAILFLKDLKGNSPLKS